jgi:hypothetical protein
MAHRGPPTFAPLPRALATPAPAVATVEARAGCARVYLPPPVDADLCRCFAVAIFEPAADAPGFLLRHALEERGGDPDVGLAASDFGALLLRFASPAAREATLALFPMPFEGHTISLERPEDGANRAAWTSSNFVLLSATGFPLEFWNEQGIRAAFCSVSSVCCVDPRCLDGTDRSALRLVIKLVDADDIPPVIFVHDAFGECSTEVRVRRVRAWSSDVDGHPPQGTHFDDAGGPASPRHPRLSDIDEASLPGPPPSPAPAARAPTSSVLSLWERVVARRRAGMARAVALDDIDGLPASTTFPPPPAPSCPPSLIWDRVLARRLAAQFPETGMDENQVPSPALSCPLPPLSRCSLAEKPLLLQWYDTLSVPATPLVPETAAVTTDVADGGLLADALEPLTMDFPVGSGALVAEPLPNASDAEHESSARKARVRRKRAVDSAFRARRSSRLAAKEAPHFETMLAKAKAAKASRFNVAGGSPRFQAAAIAAGFSGDDAPGPIPLPRLGELATVCGVDPDAVDAVEEVPAQSS